MTQEVVSIPMELLKNVAVLMDTAIYPQHPLHVVAQVRQAIHSAVGNPGFYADPPDSTPSKTYPAEVVSEQEG